MATAFLLLYGTSVSGGDPSVDRVDHSVGMIVAHANRSGIEQKKPSLRIVRVDNGSVFRDVGVSEQQHVRLLLGGVEDGVPVSRLHMNRVTVEGEKPHPSQRDNLLLRRIDAAGGQPQSGVAVAPQNIGRDIGKLPEYGIRVQSTVPEEDHGVRRSVMLAQSGTDVLRGTVGIGKNKNFHKNRPCRNLDWQKIRRGI